MSRRALLIGWAIVVVMTVAVTIFLFGVAEEGLRVAIRATVRLSTIAIAFAFAGIRTRDALIALPIAHGAHYAMIGALAVTTNPANAHINALSLPVGVLVFGTMLFAAIKPSRWAIYGLWIAFIYAFVVRMHESIIYPFIVAMLIVAALVRFAPRRVESPTTT